MDPEFSRFINEIEQNKKARNKERYSLKEEVRKAEREAAKKSEEEEKEKADEEDLYLEESAHILGDYITLSQNK
jgi:septal ring factor EnvC (AmiA/AmiB activator)